MNNKSEVFVDPSHPPPPSSTSSDGASTVSTTASTIPRSDSVRPTTFSKPSGLKPPSKIGRLCSNAAPKPAIPISPRSDVFTE
ncbi:putative restin [Danaus plexippus plexippus]|uniref:Restin n=1 Tax=Danaus plexippus plexippus TaxID=278856 RepID=A0A212EN66_DANPL|nr:putative restin [Danaus plexippus plexippus]